MSDRGSIRRLLGSASLNPPRNEHSVIRVADESCHGTDHPSVQEPGRGPSPYKNGFVGAFLNCRVQLCLLYSVFSWSAGTSLRRLQASRLPLQGPSSGTHVDAADKRDLTPHAACGPKGVCADQRFTRPFRNAVPRVVCPYTFVTHVRIAPLYGPPCPASSGATGTSRL